MRRRGWKQWIRNRRLWGLGLALSALLLVVLPPGISQGWWAYRKYSVAQWNELIAEHAAATGLDPDLVRAVVLCESSGDRYAMSPANASGLMQITPITHREAQRRFGLPEGDLFDPEHNLSVGTAYLAYLLERFDGDERLAIAAYHMGPTSVAKHVRKHPDLDSEELIAKTAGPKTRAYVERVLKEYAIYQEASAALLAQDAP